jgi:hypothetical protein
MEFIVYLCNYGISFQLRHLFVIMASLCNYGISLQLWHLFAVLLCLFSIVFGVVIIRRPTFGRPTFDRPRQLVDRVKKSFRRQTFDRPTFRRQEGRHLIDSLPGLLINLPEASLACQGPPLTKLSINIKLVRF